MTEREEQAVIVLNTLYNNPLLSDIHRQALEVGIMAIKTLSSSEKPNKWIACSDRLPGNRNQEVLISLEWGIDIGRYSDGEWHSEWIDHYDDGNVLAWMPLLEPYKANPTRAEGRNKYGDNCIKNTR